MQASCWWLKKSEREWNAPGGQQLSWLNWRDIKWKYCWRHIQFLFPAQLSHWKTIYTTTLNSLLHSIYILEYQNKKENFLLFVGMLGFTHHFYKPVLEPWTSLSKKKRHTTYTIEIECYFKWLAVDAKKRVEDHHYRHRQ
jgi:hypothetical protein